MSNVRSQGWRFTVLLGVIYLLVFHLWMVVSRNWVVLSCILATLFLVLLFFVAYSRNYFLNRWDALFHASVILDILLEGLLIRMHEGRGFYLCALGFGVVIGGYRQYLRHRQARTLP